MVDRLRLSRAQIAKIVGNDPEAIKQFEALFAARDTADTGINEVAVAAGLADSKATQAIDAMNRLADALELVAAMPVAQHNNSLVTDYIDLPEIGPHIARERRLQWNPDDGTLDVGLYGGSILQCGQELHYYAKNTTGATILNGAPVIVTGTIGASGKLQIGLAIANGTIPQKYFIGAATQDIANNAFGYVTAFGLLRGFNTSAYADGDLLYVSGTTAGQWSTTPSAFWKTTQAIVVHAATNGSIFVRQEAEHEIVLANLINNTGRLIDSSVTLTNGAAAAAGTLNNAPVAGNPTKWVAINDNGTTRYIPAW